MKQLLVSKIISAGQPGVDRGVLDALVEIGFPYGGTIPKGRVVPGGRVPDEYTQMTTAVRADYLFSLESNVVLSDATLVISRRTVGGNFTPDGFRVVEDLKLALNLCVRHFKPYLFVDNQNIRRVMDWIRSVAEKNRRPIVLNVIGLSEKKALYIQERTNRFIKSLVAALREQAEAIDVVAALIRDSQGRYLVGQRAAHKAQGGLWEFMGGKVEPGETPEQALARECREELALEIENARVVESVVHRYPDKTINLILISCSPVLGSSPTALEHQAIRWVTRDEMDALEFSPADRELIAKLFPRGEVS